jgi:hypothetical protein
MIAPPRVCSQWRDRWWRGWGMAYPLIKEVWFQHIHATRWRATISSCPINCPQSIPGPHEAAIRNGARARGGAEGPLQQLAQEVSGTKVLSRDATDEGAPSGCLRHCDQSVHEFPTPGSREPGIPSQTRSLAVGRTLPAASCLDAAARAEPWLRAYHCRP